MGLLKFAALKLESIILYERVEVVLRSREMILWENK